MYLHGRTQVHVDANRFSTSKGARRAWDKGDSFGVIKWVPPTLLGPETVTKNTVENGVVVIMHFDHGRGVYHFLNGVTAPLE